MTLRFWGVRGSIPSPAAENLGYGGNTSCVEVRAGNQIFILDAGSGIRQLGRELANEFERSRFEATLLISHTHWDHIQGLPFFQPAYSGASSIRIVGGAEMAANFRQAFSNQMSPMHFPVPLSHLIGVEQIGALAHGANSFGGTEVRSIALNHPGGCTGFRLDAAGGSIAYLPDHEPYGRGASDHYGSAEAALIQFVRQVDVLVLDSQYTNAEYPTRVGWGHGCLEESVRLAMRADVRELVLFHHDPDHDDATIDSMVNQARRIAEKAGSSLHIRGARERQAIVVSERKQLAA